jgi:hypothetical protein
MNEFDLVVVGGGAAGIFGAIQAATLKPGLSVMILEKSNKLLAKVKISGGGRCNVTHHCYDPVLLSHHYPRGEKSLRNQFKFFQAEDTVQWFKSKGVALKVENDGRMFPQSDSSQTIIDCFLQEVHRLKIKIEMEAGVTRIEKNEENLFTITTRDNTEYRAQKILIATGGNPGLSHYNLAASLGHPIVPPIPSLFTFNDSQKHFTDLMGVAVPNALVRIATTKFSQQGPVLITHWGLSGPAVIKLSAWAAEHLHQVNYHFTALVSWVGDVSEDTMREELKNNKQTRGKAKVFGNPLHEIPQRLWQKLCTLSEIDENKIWSEVPQKNLNKLMEFLIRCPFEIKGKTTFKEEFVTCGGVDLKDINLANMESKKMKNIYFAGEVLHIDGETGGFNFQAAWTTAFLAARGITGA